MLNRLIDYSLRNSFLVLVGVAALVAYGLRAVTLIPIDAFPDLTNNQVVVITDAPGMVAVEVEQLVTFPIESALMGLPDAVETRSISKFGLSMITVVFEDDLDVLTARQLVNERLGEARGRIPQGLEPQIGPLATPFGEVYQYTVESDRMSAMELKTLHDWDIKYRLRAVPGVADINTWGGFTKRFEIVVDPDRLRALGVPLNTIFERLRENNANFSGGFVEHSSEQHTVRGIGRAETIDDIESIVVSSARGTPVYLRDVADVRVGAVPRQGAVTRNGEGEAVSGMVIILKGQNGLDVIERVKATIAAMKDSLPSGVELIPFYDQSEVIDGTIETVRHNLLFGGGLVIAVLFLSLGDFRAALMVALVIPLSLLSAFLGMAMLGVSANLMSLGAVDFGMVIDGAVVMVDNCARRLQLAGGADRLETIRRAAREVAAPVLTGVAILIAVYLPILSLEGLEGRMFRPMAITVCSAVLGALVLSLTAVPVACRWFLKPRPVDQPDRVFGPLRRLYLRLLERLIRHRVLTAGCASIVIFGMIGSAAFLGREFMPRLDEGSILVQTFKLPSISLSESVRRQAEVEKALAEFPEVTDVVSKMGRPDLAIEAMGIYEGDVYVGLKPRDEWTTAATKEGLIDAMAARLREIPGMAFNFTQPMAMRLDETVSGVRADVAVKVFGEDEALLERYADEVLAVLSRVPGAADAQRQVYSGAVEWRIEIRRDQLARYGLNVSDARDLVEAAVGGKTVTEIIDGRRRFQAAVRLPASSRRDLADLGDVRLTAPNGEWARLGDIATLEQTAGPEVVFREDSRRRLVVQCNVRGRDLGSFVEEAQRKVDDAVPLPTGYYIEWGGQFEHQERAMRRLALIVPGVLALILTLIYLTFRSLGQSLLVLTLAPFAAVGGIAAVWLRGMNLSVSAVVGFIAVFGVAMIDGLVLTAAINRAREEFADLKDALLDAAGSRLRPVIMVSVVAALGFLPMATSVSTGAEVQRPLATVVIGGLVSSTLLTLLLVPTLYPWFAVRRRNNGV